MLDAATAAVAGVVLLRVVAAAAHRGATARLVAVTIQRWTRSTWIRWRQAGSRLLSACNCGICRFICH
jgi:hypothetical protein